MRVDPGGEHASVPVDRSGPPELAALADPARLAALRRTELLGGPPSEPLQRIAGMTAAQLGVPAVLATVVDADGEREERAFTVLDAHG